MGHKGQLQEAALQVRVQSCGSVPETSGIPNAINGQDSVEPGTEMPIEMESAAPEPGGNKQQLCRGRGKQPRVSAEGRFFTWRMLLPKSAIKGSFAKPGLDAGITLKLDPAGLWLCCYFSQAGYQPPKP